MLPRFTWRLCLYAPYLIETLDCEITKLFKSLTETQAFKHFSQTQSIQSVLRCEQRSVFSLSKSTMGTTVPFFSLKAHHCNTYKRNGKPELLSSPAWGDSFAHRSFHEDIFTPIKVSWFAWGHSCWNQDILQPKMGKV